MWLDEHPVANEEPGAEDLMPYLKDKAILDDSKPDYFDIKPKTGQDSNANTYIFATYTPKEPRVATKLAAKIVGGTGLIYGDPTWNTQNGSGWTGTDVVGTDGKINVTNAGTAFYYLLGSYYKSTAGN